MGACPHRKLKDGVYDALRGCGGFPPKERARDRRESTRAILGSPFFISQPCEYPLIGSSNVKKLFFQNVEFFLQFFRNLLIILTITAECRIYITIIPKCHNYSYYYVNVFKIRSHSVDNLDFDIPPTKSTKEIMAKIEI